MIHRRLDVVSFSLLILTFVFDHGFADTYNIIKITK